MRRKKFKTAQGYKTFVDDLSSGLMSFRKYHIKSVVVAVPGIVQKSYSVSFGNRKWDKIDLYTPIKSLFDCPIYFENDANLATLYESYNLPGKTIFLTFSTGIGAGIAEDNRILPESSQLEPGHIQYTFGDKRKEWEDIAAASAIEHDYHVEWATNLRGQAIMKDIADRVALGLPELVDKYHPNTIILGGPLGKIFRLYSKYLPNLGVKYQRPKRPNESVIYGCFLYAKQKEQE